MEIIDTQALAATDNYGADTLHWLYNGLDCCVTADILTSLRPMADDITDGVYDFSRALQAPILEMNLRGLRVNQAHKHKVLFEMRGKLVQLAAQLEQLISEGVGVKDLNWRSPLQLNALFYDVMNLPVQKKRNANGAYTRSSDREAVEKLSMYYIVEPICNHLLALRDLGKSISFLETGIDPDGRMRTSFNIAGTNTGRFSSSVTDFGTGTNLQNVTSKLRSVFVADPGMKFANLDLEQADARNVGALAWQSLVNKDGWSERTAGAYLDLCESGDLHTNVLKLSNPNLGWDVAGKSDREVADGMAYRHLTHRDLAKKLGHGSNYLGTPPTMAKHAKLPVPLVKDFQQRYFQTFPCISGWHETIFRELETTSQLTTPFGRRRFFWARSNDAATRREAVAYQPQSMTADEINRGILRLWQSGRVQLLIQVHDSILLQYREEEEDEILPWIKEQLITYLTLKHGREFHVPVEAQVGWNWGYAGEENPDGLKKYRGTDTRRRTETNFKLSLRGM